MVALYLRKALEGAPLEKAAERLKTDLATMSYALRGAVEAAAARLEVVARHTVLGLPDGGLQGAGSGVYLLAEIPSLWERAELQQFLATFFTLARAPGAWPPLLLAVEEGGMGARTSFLKRLVALARRRNVKVLFISQSLPDSEVLDNFEILLFDAGYATRRELRAPIPDSQLRPGECWWVRRAGPPVKLRFAPR